VTPFIRAIDMVQASPSNGGTPAQRSFSSAAMICSGSFEASPAASPPSTALLPHLHHERARNNDGLEAIFDTLELTVVRRRDAWENSTEA